MRKNKVCTFYLKTFRKLQEFLEDRTEEELNREKSDQKEIEKLIALQDYIAKSAIIDCKEDTATIELSIKIMNSFSQNFYIQHSSTMTANVYTINFVT